jgi:SSS family transporter
MLTAFLIYLVGVGALGWVAHRFLTEGQFVKDYFLGNRRLGPWVLALSFAATAISGGTFMGFPALIYTNGWVMALWIAGYMFVPLCTMAVLGKRINQASRLSGSITIPDVLRDRFESPSIAVLTSLILILFLGVNLVAQFKAGGLLMLEAWREVIESSSTFQGQVVLGSQSVPRDYLFGVSLFVIMVVAYTTYGGFWGVTLTDVLEGLIMLFGAVTLAVLALVKVGGLGEATAALLREDPALVYGPGPPVLGAEGAILRPGFLPPHLAVSFFIQWTIIGIAQPGQLVRLMSFREMKSLQRALCLCAVYYALIYASLLVVFICARALYPPAALGVTKTDDIMPFMIRQLASPISTVLAGILLAAPYAAIMSTVAAYLLIVSSSLVRDIYQRMLRPKRLRQDPASLELRGHIGCRAGRVRRRRRSGGQLRFRRSATRHSSTFPAADHRLLDGGARRLSARAGLPRALLARHDARRGTRRHAGRAGLPPLALLGRLHSAPRLADGLVPAHDSREPVERTGEPRGPRQVFSPWPERDVGKDVPAAGRGLTSRSGAARSPRPVCGPAISLSSKRTTLRSMAMRWAAGATT